MGRDLERMKKYCTTIRVLAHSQVSKTPLSQKKAHLMEVQINGGSIADKVDFGHGLFEKPVEIGSIFEQDEMIDCIRQQAVPPQPVHCPHLRLQEARHQPHRHPL